MAPVVKLLASLSSFMIRWTKGKSIGVTQELKPMRNQAANFIPTGIYQIRRQMFEKMRTVPVKRTGIQMGYTLQESGVSTVSQNPAQGS
jgi:hypothetical protein